MVDFKLQTFFSRIIIAIGFIPLTTIPVIAQNFPDVPRPQTGGEWGQLLAPIGEVQGSFGPQPFMDDVGLNIKEFRPFIEEELLRAIQQDQPAQFNKIEIKSDPEFPLEAGSLELSEFEGHPLTLHDYNQLAEKVSKHCQAKNRIYQISFRRINQTVLEVELKHIQFANVKLAGSCPLKGSVVHRVTGMHDKHCFDVCKIEKKLRILQDNPDIKLEASLEPVEMDGTANLVLRPKLQRSIHLASFWSNLDQTYYGGQVTGISAISNNVTGNGDTLMVTVIPDKQEHGVYTHYEIPVNSYGTRFGVDFSNMRANPKGYAFNPYNIRGKAWAITTTLNQVLLAKSNMRLSTDLNFDLKQFTTKSDGTIIERENMRDLRWGLQFTHSGEHHELASRQEATLGVPIMGATPNSYKNVGNLGGGSQFFRYIGTMYYLRNLPGNTALVLNGVGQWSPGTLSSTDLGGIGGTYWGRGYPEAFVQADSLLYGSAEFRFPAFMVPKKLKLPKDEQAIHDKIHFLTFFDYAYAKVNNKALVPDPTTSIASTGVGVRVEFCKNLSGRLDLGIPLIKPSRDMMPINHYHPRIHFGLQANVL